MRAHRKLFLLLSVALFLLALAAVHSTASLADQYWPPGELTFIYLPLVLRSGS